jgi:hypothetical protein
MPSTPSKIYLAFAVPLLFLVMQVIPVCTDINADPEEALNDVGTTHTVFVEIDDDTNGLFDWELDIFIFFGPNSGTASDDDCDPSCFGSGDGEVSWIYESNGEPGTDYIAVCGIFEINIPLNVQLVVEIPEEELEDYILGLEEAGCDVVRKTWVGESVEEEEDDEPTSTPTRTPTRTPTSTPTITPTPQPNRQGVVDAILPSQRRDPTPTPAAASGQTQPTVSPQAPAVVRPPSTGDGGVSRW